MPNTNGAFTGVPSDQHGVLAIQPLVALGRLSLQSEEMLTINGKNAPSIGNAPMMFVGTTPLTQIEFRGPEVVEGRNPQSHAMNGLFGTTAQGSASVPHLTLKFGREVELAPATILLDQTTGASAWAAANFGYDLILQGQPFTLDFRKMKIEFTARP